MPDMNVIPDLFGNLAGREESPLGQSSPQRPAAGCRIFRRRCHFAKLLHNDRPSTALQCGSLCAMG